MKTAYWKNSKGFYPKERAETGLFRQENKSVAHLYEVIRSQALTRATDVLQLDGSIKFWDPGSRKWSLRMLADAAGLAINTVRTALKRLEALKLIEYASNKLGTVIKALKFWKYDKDVTTWKDPLGGLQTISATKIDTRVSTIDTYRSLDKGNSINPNGSCSGNPPAGLGVSILKEEKPTAEAVAKVKAMLRKEMAWAF